VRWKSDERGVERQTPKTFKPRTKKPGGEEDETHPALVAWGKTRGKERDWNAAKEKGN